MQRDNRYSRRHKGDKGGEGWIRSNFDNPTGEIRIGESEYFRKHGMPNFIYQSSSAREYFFSKIVEFELKKKADFADTEFGTIITYANGKGEIRHSAGGIFSREKIRVKKFRKLIDMISLSDMGIMRNVKP